MNQKRSAESKKSSIRPILVVGVLLGIVAALGVGIYLGRQGEGPDPEAPGGSGVGASAGVQTGGLSPADVAKAKNVPEILEDPTGDYQLVAVVEGGEQNRKLTQNLQVVGAQRQRLLALAQQYERLPAEAEAQRELLGMEVNGLRQTLEKNLAFMAKSYGYSLRMNYRLVPHAATMLLVDKGADGTASTTVAHEFKDSKSYENFQALREEFLIQSVAEAKQRAGGGSEGPAVEGGEPGTIADKSVADDGSAAPAFEPSAELKAMAGDLKTLYNYDSAKTYQINLEKTALYARQGTQ
jgi:hypothetical protein